MQQLLFADAMIKVISLQHLQALSNTVYAFSKLGEVDEALFNAIADASVTTVFTANAQNISNLVWSYANISYEPPGPLLDAMAEATLKRLDGFSGQNVSNLMWGMARLNRAPEKLLAAVASHAAVHMAGGYQPQSIANLLWAYATLGKHPGANFISKALSHARDTLTSFSPQNLANAAWSLATLKDTNSQDFMKTFAEEVTQRLTTADKGQFALQNLSNIIWAYATMDQQPGNALLEAVGQAMAARAAECGCQELTNTVWSFAKLGRYDQTLMDAFAAECQSRISELSPQHLSNLAWAYGKLAHFDQVLQEAIAEQTAAKTQDLALQHLTNITWSFACLGLTVPTMTEAVRAELTARFETEAFNPQQLSNLLWALAVLQRCDLPLWRAVMQQFGKLCAPPAAVSDLPAEALTQVHQARLLLQMELPAGQQLDGPPGLLQQAARTWATAAGRVHVSEFQYDVAHHLRTLNISHELERMTADGAFSIDIALTQEHIAIEVDGPHHFAANTRTVLGETKGRRRLLSHRGWTVISVPFWHWDAATSAANKQRYLSEAVSRARIQQSERRLDPSVAAGIIVLSEWP